MRADQLRNPAVLVATGFGAGLAPRAPGTVGTLLAIPLWWLLSAYGAALYLLVTAIGFIAGVRLCERAMAILGDHDHPGIVIDEVFGYLAALVVVPAEGHWVLASFVVFRIFDILKPWPIRWLDRNIGGGLGVMLDDLIAGLFTAVVMLAALLWTA